MCVIAFLLQTPENWKSISTFLSASFFAILTMQQIK